MAGVRAREREQRRRERTEQWERVQRAAEKLEEDSRRTAKRAMNGHYQGQHGRGSEPGEKR